MNYLLTYYSCIITMWLHYIMNECTLLELIIAKKCTDDRIFHLCFSFNSGKFKLIKVEDSLNVPATDY